MRVLLCLVVIGWVAMSGVLQDALAQTTPAHDEAKVNVAKQYVDAGLAAQNSGDYEMAITLYSKAYQLVPHPVLLFNLAQAHRLAGHLEQAIALYRRYIAADAQGAQVAAARELLAEIEARKAEPAQPMAASRKADTTGKSSTASKSEAARKPEPVRKAGRNHVDEAVVADRDTLLTHTDMAAREPEGADENTHAASVGGNRSSHETALGDGTGPSKQSANGTVDGSLPSPQRSSTMWRWSLAATATVTATAAGFSLYSWRKAVATAPPGTNEDDCGSPYEPRVACKWHSRHKLGLVVTGVGVAGMLVSSILWVRDSWTAKPSGAEARSNKPSVAIVPVLAPDRGGAALSLAW